MKSSTKYHALIDSEEDQLAVQETPPIKDDLDYFYIWIAIVLLAASCIIMQVAWYLHLKYDHWNYRAVLKYVFWSKIRFLVKNSFFVKNPHFLTSIKDHPVKHNSNF